MLVYSADGRLLEEDAAPRGDILLYVSDRRLLVGGEDGTARLWDRAYRTHRDLPPTAGASLLRR